MATGGMTVTLYGRPARVRGGRKQVTGHVVLCATSNVASGIEKYFRRCRDIDFGGVTASAKTGGCLIRYCQSTTNRLKGLIRKYGASARISAAAGPFKVINEPASGTFVATGW